MENGTNKQVLNPFLPFNEYIPDGEPHVFGDRVYLYGSHDQEGGKSFCPLDYTVYSAPVENLREWKCHGVTYRASQDPRYGKHCAFMAAPDCVQGPDGRYYLYYTFNYDGGISVAVSNDPGGPFAYYGIVRNPDGSVYHRFVPMDPAVINDNGTIRLYYGTSYFFEETDSRILRSCYHLVEGVLFGKSQQEIASEPGGVMGAIHVTLGEDMLTVVSDPVRIMPSRTKGTEFEGHGFFEASSIRKIGDTYYFIWSSRNNHELCYATSSFPDRDFHYRGVIVSNGDIGLNGRSAKERLNLTGNTHGSIEKINGQWYVFYHRHTHNSSYSRQACAEPIEIASDGSIAQAALTSCGLNGKPLNASGSYPAFAACNLTNGHMPHVVNGFTHRNIPIFTHKNGEHFIQNVHSGTHIGWKYFAFSGETTLRVTARGDGGCLQVGTQWDTPLAELKLQPSSTWTVSQPIAFFAQGIQPLYLTYCGKGKIDLLAIILGSNERKEHQNADIQPMPPGNR